MISRPIQLQDLAPEQKATLGHWLDLLPPTLWGKIQNYVFGEEITFSEVGGREFGFVLSGTLEVCEVYEFDRKTTYRPIRVLSSGEMFGDFSILDSWLGCAGATRRGETWGLFAGARSILIAQSVDPGDQADFKKTEPTVLSAHLALPKIFPKVRTTLLILDGGDLAESSMELRFAFHQYSWPRAKIYRDCLNSFNFREFLFYKEAAYRTYDGLMKQKVGSVYKYARFSARREVLDVFLDALWDACNRPVRCEPLFVASTPATFNMDGIAYLKLRKIDPCKVWLPCGLDVPVHTGWFPLDRNNFIIGAHAQAVLSKGDVLKTETFKRGLDKVFATRHRVDKKPCVGTSDIQTRLPPKKLYQDLANTLIAEFILPRYSGYLFDVECKEVDGFDSKWLVLEFSKKMSA